jgi:periplasmic divalent cation tolerance protein
LEQWRVEVCTMTAPRDTRILSLATTVATLDDARRLARALLDQRLAACVQIDPGVESRYRWEGALCAEPEVRLTVKSLPDRLPALQDFFGREHPYQLPQLLWHVDESSPAYAAWVRQEVSAR